MPTSPFQFGKTVSNSLFVNRESEKKRLVGNFKSGINTILISPRRWGKSSLVRETARLALEQDKNIRFCFLDVFSLSSEEEFYEVLTRELIKCTSSKLEDWLQAGKEFFKNIVPRFSYGLDPIEDFSVSLDWKQAAAHRDELLNLPERIAQKKGIRLVVCIDEFQNIRHFAHPDAFEKALRSQWQHHQHACYCLYGSKRNMMAGIFTEKSRPFYRFGELMLLGKIEKAHWITHLVRSFDQTQKQISPDLAAHVVESMRCHSYYVQQLAHIVWSLTDQTVEDVTVQAAIQELLQHNDALYQREIESLSTTQIHLLKAIIEGVTQFTSAQIMLDYRLGTPRNVSKNKEILRNTDFIELQNGKMEFLDPAFELWFKKIYLGRPI